MINDRELIVRNTHVQALSLVLLATIGCGSNYSPALADAKNLDAHVATNFDAHQHGTCSSPSFAPRAVVSAGGSLVSVSGIAIGDLNHDGFADLAVVNPVDTISVLLGDGTGSFAPRMVIDTDHNVSPFGIVIADVNDDGDADLLVSYTEIQDIAVLLGDGHGGFVLQPATPIFGGASSIVVADLDGDGHVDLAASNGLGAIFDVLLGAGDATFGSPTTYQAQGNVNGVVVADFNGDHHLDLAGVTSDLDTSGNVGVLLGSDTGTLGTITEWPAGIEPLALASADLDGDGNIDLVAVNSLGTTASVLLGDGTGSFAADVQYPIGNGSSALVIGDFNGDGAPDIATANSTDGTVSVLLGHGDGTFADQATFAAGDNDFWIASGDLNGDGLADIAVGNSTDGTVSVLLNTCAK